MTTLREIEDALYEYAVASTGKRWIHQSSEEAPELPYGVIRLATINQLGTEGKTQTTVYQDDIEQRADAYYEVTYSFLFRGDGARQTILDLINKMNLESYKNFLKERDIGFQDFTGITDLTGLDIDIVREQATTDLNINAVLTASEVVPFIKTVEIDYVENTP